MILSMKKHTKDSKTKATSNDFYFNSHALSTNFDDLKNTMKRKRS